jgi:RimJ/RimL family protein N-acetyltransferase
MRSYKCLTVNHFSNGSYSLVPIRDEDKFEIMQWRNDQIDILRQKELLTKNQQENYFKNVVDRLFEKEQPDQILWSFLYKEELIGYGGLVHIDWENKVAEISFLTETSRNKNIELFISDWTHYLDLIKQIANLHLNFKSIFTYAYDIRPDLYIALENSKFKETKRIKNFIEIDNELKDVVIHTFNFFSLSMKLAKKSDIDLYFTWTNDSAVRKNSYQQKMVNYDAHVKWFNSKIDDKDFKFYLFENENRQPIGQVRINKNLFETIVGISIDEQYRGFGYGAKMLVLASQNYFELFSINQITAYIKINNLSSINIFKKAGFVEDELLIVNGINSIKLILHNERY